jgi:hypothetical protein
MNAIAVAALVVVVFAGVRLLLRTFVARPFTERFGSAPWMPFFIAALVGAVTLSKLSRVDSSTGGILVAISLITFLSALAWLLWQRNNRR